MKTLHSANGPPSGMHLIFVCCRTEAEDSLSLAWAVTVIIAYSRGALDFPIFYALGPHFRKECDSMLCEILAVCFRTYRLKLITIAPRTTAAETTTGSSAVLRHRPGSVDTISTIVHATDTAESGTSHKIRLAAIRRSVKWTSSKTSLQEPEKTAKEESGRSLESSSTSKHLQLPLLPIHMVQKRFSSGAFWAVGMLTPIKEMSYYSTTPAATTTSVSASMSSSGIDPPEHISTGGTSTENAKIMSPIKEVSQTDPSSSQT